MDESADPPTEEQVTNDAAADQVGEVPNGCQPNTPPPKQPKAALRTRQSAKRDEANKTAEIQWRDLELKARELDIAERKVNADIEFRKAEIDANTKKNDKTHVWQTAPVIAVIGGCLTLITAIVGNLIKGYNDSVLRNQEHNSQIALERQKLQSELIQNAVESGDHETVAVNLNFLWNAGLIPDYDQIPVIVRQSGQLQDSKSLLPGLDQYDPDTGPVVGNDDRREITDKQLDPYRSICRLSTTAPDGARLYSTGFFVAPNVIVTSGHFLFMYERGGTVEEVSVTLSSNTDTEPPRVVTAKPIHVAIKWVVSGDRQHDYGVVVLEKALPEVGTLELHSASQEELESTEVRVVGYPMDKPKHSLWYSVGQASPVLGRRFGHDADTYGGMGGSPVLVMRNGRAKVVGIHVSNAGETRAIRLTKDVIDTIEEWVDDINEEAPGEVGTLNADAADAE